MSELGRGDFVGHADIVEEFDGDKISSRNEAWPLLFGVCFVRVGVEVHFVLREFRLEDEVVRCIAKGVESFVGVFDGEFDDGRVIKAIGMDSSVQMSAMARALVGGENQELGNPQPGRQLCRPDFVWWVGLVADGGRLRLVSPVVPPAVCRRISNDRVLRSSWRRRGHLLIPAFRQLSHG